MREFYSALNNDILFAQLKGVHSRTKSSQQQRITQNLRVQGDFKYVVLLEKHELQ